MATMNVENSLMAVSVSRMLAHPSFTSLAENRPDTVKQNYLRAHEYPVSGVKLCLPMGKNASNSGDKRQ